MDLSKLAVALGLDKDSPSDKILTAAAKAVADGVTARESLSNLTAELPKHGFKLDQGKVIRTEPIALDIVIKPEDSPETIRLKEELLKGRKEAFARQQEQLNRLVASGKVAPAMAEKLGRFLSGIKEFEAIALSQDGAQDPQAIGERLGKVEEALKLAVELLGATPGVILADDKGKLRPGLRTVALSDPPGPEGEKDAEALARKGAEIHKRVSPERSKSAKAEKAGAGK